LSEKSKIKPISYLKANAVKIFDGINDTNQTYIITQNGEAKAVVQDYRQFEQARETMALLKILAQGNREIEQGGFTPLEISIQTVREKLSRNQDQ